MATKRGRKKAPPRTGIVVRPERMPLRTVEDLSKAHEWLLNQEKDGNIDPKMANALNATLRGSVFLNVKLKLDVAKLIYNASIRKMTIPQNTLPV